LVVIHELLLTEWPARRPAGNGDREVALPEQRDAGLEVHPKAIDLAGFDQLGRLEHLGWRDPLGGSHLILRPPCGRPPLVPELVFGLVGLGWLVVAIAPAGPHPRGLSRADPRLDEVPPRHARLRRRGLGRVSCAVGLILALVVGPKILPQ